MDTPTVAQNRTMPEKDLAKLNRELTKRLAINAMGMIFVKIAVTNLAKTLATGAAITAARKL